MPFPTWLKECSTSRAWSQKLNGSHFRKQLSCASQFGCGQKEHPWYLIPPFLFREFLRRFLRPTLPG
jgi:hypothetical protein